MSTCGFIAKATASEAGIVSDSILATCWVSGHCLVSSVIKENESGVVSGSCGVPANPAYTCQVVVMILYLNQACQFVNFDFVVDEVQ